MQEELDSGERREYHNYNYSDRGWESQAELSDVTPDGERGWRDQERTERTGYYDTRAWDQRNGYAGGSGHTTVGWNDYDYGHDRSYYQWRGDQYYGGYGYHRWRDDHDDRDIYRGRRWSYDSYYDKDLFNEAFTDAALK